MDEHPDETNPHSIVIMYTSIREHAVKILRKKWRKLGFALFGAWGGCWLLVETGSYFFKADLSGIFYAALFGIFSFIFAVIHTVFVYLKTPPPELKNLSLELQRLSIIRRPLWEYRFAYLFLEEKLSAIDEHLEDVLSGKVFVKKTKILDVSDYIKWFKIRQTNLLYMVETAKRLIIFEFPNTLKETGKKENCNDILKCLEQIEDFYQETCQYEIECKEVEPPKPFQKIHEIQSGWLVPIRGGIRQILDYLDNMSKLNLSDLRKGTLKIEFTTTFDRLPRIDEFNYEIKQLEYLEDKDINFLQTIPNLIIDILSGKK